MPENYITVPGEQGNVYIAEDVLTAIVGAAVAESEGVASLTAAAPGFTERLGLRSANRGVSVTVEEGKVRVDAAIYAKYGESIASVGEKAQRAAAAAVESMTGLECVVNVLVAGVTFS